MSLSRFLATFSTCALLLGAASASAQDYQDAGFYLGMNGIGAIELFDGDLDDTGGLNVRAGYRFLPWLAGDVFYEWASDFSPVDAFELSAHSIIVNAKFILPNWRAQPYVLFGMGTEGLQLQAPGGFDETEWGFALRPALGVDVFLTENLVLNAEWGTTTGFFDDIDDQTYMSLGGGLQYRF